MNKRGGCFWKCTKLMLCITYLPPLCINNPGVILHIQDTPWETASAETRQTRSMTQLHLRLMGQIGKKILVLDKNRGASYPMERMRK